MTRRLLVHGGALLLVVIAFLQRPGRVTFDTKLDLAENPIGFMARALHLWNPSATSGELQQQAYGYLFPMGPFFAAGDLLGVPPWITQRLWCAVLLCAAYYGTVLLARAMRIGTGGSRVAGGLAYATAPRMLTEIGPLSSEMLPVVMLPWVLLPLVTVKSPRRAAALSALAVLLMGGINAAAVVMALVLPGIYLLTRRWDRRLAALMGWWFVCVTAATLWWIVPLLLFGRYSLPFLDYIESSATTTAVTSLFQALRGTNQWVGYIVQGEPWWSAGWILVDNPALMAVTAVVAILGLAGLALRDLPEQRFLVLGALTGLTLLTVGYVGTLDSPAAPLIRELLDGPLAPLRNVHKWEPVLRLPVALGLAYLAGRRLLARPAVAALVLAAAAPAWMMVLRPGPGWAEIPSHWTEATAWLADHGARDRTLVVPGSGFAQSTWGRTVDEPMQALATTPWATRNQIPLGSEGNIRVLDAVEAVLAEGRGSAALSGFLARAGYRYLLVRHDLDRSATGAPPIAVVRAAVTGSPGLSRAATFGAAVTAGGAQVSPADAGLTVPAVEIFEVDRPVPLVTATTLDSVPVVSGGPESLLGVLDQGLIDPAQPAVLDGDQAVPQAGGGRIVTDGLRRRELNIGRIRDNVSQTLTLDEQTRQGRVRDDVLPFPAEGHQTVAVYQGIRAVDASSGAAFADSLAASDPSALPFAALDGDDGTAWRSDPNQAGPGQWLSVELETAKRVTEVTVDFADDLRIAAPVAMVRLTTDQGSVDRPVPATTGPHRLSTLPGLTTSVRVTVLALREGYQGAVALRELGIPGLDATRALRVPATGGSYVFERARQQRGACFPACDQFLRRVGEEPLGVDRLFTTSAAATYDLGLTALPRPGGTLPFKAQAAVSASSVLTGDVTVGAHAAIDGDPATSWLAEPGDDRPTLTLSWTAARKVDRFRLVTADSPVTARPTQVLVTTTGDPVAAAVGEDGWVRLPATTTKRLVITVTATTPVIADPRGNGWPAPAGIAEVTVPGLSLTATALAAECGTGPAVEIDGRSYPTSVSGTLDDVRAGRPLPVTVCDDFVGATVTLPAGEHRIRTLPSAAYVGQSIVLAAGGTRPAVTHRATTVEEWGAASRTVTVAAGAAALLVVPENHNAGWAATLDGVSLPAVRVDGWQQAFLLPAGDGGTVTLTFTPDVPYRVGLAAGAVFVLLVVLLALIPVRRVSPVTAAGRPGWSILVPLLALAVLLGGFAAVSFLLAMLIVRQLWPRALPWVTAGFAGLGALIAVAGRLLDHQQEWAYGAPVQLAIMAAVFAMAATIAPSAPQPSGATLARSITLFRTFLVEQSDPDRFYSLLARDSVAQIKTYTDLSGQTVVDVGGGPGYFAAEFRAAGAVYHGLDPAVGDFAASGAAVAGMIRGSGTALPIRTGAVDVTYSSNVLEHVPDPEALLDELLRVTRPGGTVFVSYTPWLSPHGGHETGPWHLLLGGRGARRRYIERHGHEPKNRFGETLFPISAARTMRWVRSARRAGLVTVVDVLPRYHPKWACWVARVPVLRELLTWNFTVVLRRTPASDSADIQEDRAEVSLLDVTR
ncbi:alpha-(1-_3)-arabinofuranosyltransferase domain-containing protein [Actinoplanes rectilineatus]|uniref:alpha-(1->3)-arabinofuranosyltransferase domain-containing protein n=1 Tax=Actinoplanes rectilineatus TaxID=113571 RepID=UPI0005F2EC63|nr:alpha-(1->3)-arabinofuranosyltransferase family protein [Actinoplanes rectilineatus]